MKFQTYFYSWYVVKHAGKGHRTKRGCERSKQFRNTRDNEECKAETESLVTPMVIRSFASLMPAVLKHFAEFATWFKFSDDLLHLLDGG